MSVVVPHSLAAHQVLKEQAWLLESAGSAPHDGYTPLVLRPLRIAVANLMPNKEVTEIQLLRLLGAAPWRVEVQWLHAGSHTSKYTHAEHLRQHYLSLDEARGREFDGVVVTGAPVEQLEFRDVDYWDELCVFFDWIEANSLAAMLICWGAQAALQRWYGIPKYALSRKLSGVFEHRRLADTSLVSGFDDVFWVPHSRHTTVLRGDIDQVSDLRVLAASDEAGLHLIATRDERRLFVMGHPEYDATSLQQEYTRDRRRQCPVDPPRHYFLADDPGAPAPVRWRSHAVLMFANWLCHAVARPRR